MRESAMNVFPDLQIHNKIMLKNKNSKIGVSTINSAHFKVSINSGFLENLTYSNWILHQISRITYFLLNMSSFYFILCNSFHPTWVAGTSRLVGKSSFPWPATGHVITGQLIQDGGALCTGPAVTTSQLIQDGGARSTGHVIAGQLIQDGNARSTGHVIACQLIQDGVALSVGAGQNIGVIHRSCPQDKVRLSRPIDHFNNIINMNINVKQIKD